MKFRLQPQKKNSITKKNSVSFTNRRWPTPNYNVCCVTRQYFFTIHFFASQRLSEGPACLYIKLYLSPPIFIFFFQIQVVRRSLSLSTKYYVTKRSPHCFWRKDPILTTITLCWYFLFFSLLHEDRFFGFVLVTRWVQMDNIHRRIMFLLVTRNFLPLCPV